MYCISHSADLDGFTSGAIVKLAMKEKNRETVFIGYNYGKPVPYDKLERGKPVVMIDVSLPMDEMLELAKFTGWQLTWIDHHKSAIEDYRKFVGDGENFLTPVLQDGIAACEVAWKYYFPDRPMPEAIELLGKYDTWRDNGTEYWDAVILPFQYGMRLHCNSPESFPLGILNDNSYVKETVQVGRAILKYQMQQNEVACKSAFEGNFEGYKAILCNMRGANSIAFKSVYDEAKHDLMMPFGFNGKFWVVSIYTTKEIDCSAIAKLHGGGGHAGAAGFQLEDINEFLASLK